MLLAGNPQRCIRRRSPVPAATAASGPGPTGLGVAESPRPWPGASGVGGSVCASGRALCLVAESLVDHGSVALIALGVGGQEVVTLAHGLVAVAAWGAVCLARVERPCHCCGFVHALYATTYM